ncbi:hypothetical protein IB243_22760 [Acidovorax sp. ACV01]|nr:hypothetical protein [Acidovorax sp. ACV01]
MNHRHLNPVRLYAVRAGKATHHIWATSECDAIAKAHGLGLPASAARKVAL